MYWQVVGVAERRIASPLPTRTDVGKPFEEPASHSGITAGLQLLDRYSSGHEEMQDRLMVTDLVSQT